jgi:hypothetical protein
MKLFIVQSMTLFSCTSPSVQNEHPQAIIFYMKGQAGDVVIFKCLDKGEKTKVSEGNGGNYSQI